MGNSPYLVLQTHFLKPASSETEEEVGEIEVEFVSEFPEKVLSMSLFVNSHFALPPKEDEVQVEAECCMEGSGSADLFAFRVHAHNYARNITLSVDDRLVAWGDPQLPHYFTKIDPKENPKQLNFGSDWMATCSYNTESADGTVHVGQGHNNEMCNLYLMLSSHVPLNSECLSPGVPLNSYPDCLLPNYVVTEQYLEERLSVKAVLEIPGLGQIAGLHMGYKGDPNKMLIFHRADRVMQNFLVAPDREERIQDDVLIVWDTKTNEVTERFGAGMFVLPHGLTIDRERNIWLTDVETQLAYKLDPSGGLLFTVGTDGVRGRDEEHLCLPTEVAVSNYGAFFVSSGYCDERVVKYDSKTGEVISEFHLPEAGVPHSVVLDDCRSRLLVADREMGRIRLLDANDGTESPPVDLKEYGKVYSVTKDEFGNVYALCWDRERSGKVYFVQLQKKGNPSFFVSYDPVGVELPNITFPHDFSVTYNFAEHSLRVSVGETGRLSQHDPHGRVTLFDLRLL